MYQAEKVTAWIAVTLQLMLSLVLHAEEMSGQMIAKPIVMLQLKKYAEHVVVLLVLMLQ